MDETKTMQDAMKVAEQPINKGSAVTVTKPSIKTMPYDPNAAAFIESLAVKTRGHGALTLTSGREVDRIRKNVLRQCAEYFGRKIPDTSSAPFDLQDKIGDTAVSRIGVPLVQVLKVRGADAEIGHGGASLAETALLYAHPVLTASTQVLMALGTLSVTEFIMAQAVYAMGTLALLGRNWRYVVRPTAQYTMGMVALQAAAASILGSAASPLIAIGNVLMLSRPFLEPYLNNRSGERRHFRLPNAYEQPDDKRTWDQRATQIKNASDFASNGPVIVIATARGDSKSLLKDPLAPDAGMPMGLSAHQDLKTHLLVLGQTGFGKTYGILTPLVQQWLTLGTIRKGLFENCGGALLLDGKGHLPDDIIAALQEQRLDDVLEVIRVTPEPGGQPIALLEGMTPNEVTSALLDVNNTPGEEKDFFKVSPGNWLRHASRLLRACVDLEMLLLEAKARTLGHANYQAWSDALDEQARAKTKSDGTNWGFAGWRHYVEWRKQHYQGVPVPPPYKEAVRHFYWHFTGLNDFTMMYMEDSEFITATPLLPDPKTGAAPLPSEAPKMQDIIGGMGVTGGLVGWLTKNHPDMKANNDQGRLIKQSLQFAKRELPGMRPELRSDIRATLSSWLTPIMDSDTLGSWANLEKGCDVLACLRGAVVGISLPETLYKEAGLIITTLAKQRVFNAIKSRPDDWQDRFPDQRPVLCVADEAHLLIGPNNDENTMLSIARSLGLRCVFATQTVDAFLGRLGDDNGYAFMSNFVSWVTLRSTKRTNEWANDRLKEQRVVKYSFYLSGALKTLLSTDFQRHHEAALNDLSAGTREVEPGRRQTLLKRLRYDVSRPSDVTLSMKDRKALEDRDDRSGRLPRSLLKLALMFSVGAVTTNVLEAVVGTGSLLKTLAQRTGNALSRRFMGGTVEHEDYTPPRFDFEEKDVELFPKENWSWMNDEHTAMMELNRGGVPRRDLCTTIGKLSVAQIREYARLQGVPTIYDVMDQRAERAAADAAKRAAGAANDAGQAAA